MNAVGLNFVSGFCKNIKQHNCFIHGLYEMKTNPHIRMISEDHVAWVMTAENSTLSSQD